MNNNSLLEFNIAMNPTRVEVELTEYCNLKCKFCYNSQEHIVSNKIFNIIERLHDMGVIEIVLTGGEPLSHPQFNEILSKCSKCFQKVMIQTNGTLIDDAIIKFFQSNAVHCVNVSIHGEKKLHEKLTLVDGSYDKAYNALKSLISHRIKTISNYVLTSENISDFPHTIKNLHDIGVGGMTITRFTPAGVGAKNSSLMISSEQLISALEFADNFRKNCSNKNFFVLLANSVPYCALPKHLKHYCEYCHFGASRFYIDTKGNVLMCGMSRLPIGNILNEDFSEMKRKSIVYCEHVCGLDIPLQCKVCPNFKKCRGGCRAAALACSSKRDGFDPLCVIKGNNNE